MNKSNNLSIVEILGSNIKHQRLSHGWTQKQLADKAKLNMNYVSDTERGRRNISLANANKIANALNVNIIDLFISEYALTAKNNDDLKQLSAAETADRTASQPASYRKVLSIDDWKKLSDNNKTDEQYEQYLNEIIDHKKPQIIKIVMTNQNPKDLEYSFEDNLNELKDSGEYYDILHKIGFAVSNNPNRYDYRNFEDKYFDWDKTIEDKVNEVFKTAYEQSKAEYKSATIDNSLSLPKDDDPED